MAEYYFELSLKDLCENIVTRNTIFWKYGNILPYENMLQSIAIACSEFTAKHEDKASYNTAYVVADLIDFLGND